MATVKLDKFGGIAPRVHPSLLPDGMATTAHNCRLKNGKARPLRQPAELDRSQHTVYHENGLGDIADAKSVFCWKHTTRDGTVRTDFLAFPGRVYFAHGNIADDVYDRIFATGETGATTVQQNGTFVHDCAVAYMFDRERDKIVRHILYKEALDAPRCSLDGTLDENDIAYAYFFFSWFDEFGYESPASAPSLNLNSGTSYTKEPLMYSQNSVVRFGPLYLPAAARGVRVYKTNAGDETDNIQFVKEFGRGELLNLQNEFTIRIDDTQAGETMPEIEAPPADLCDMTAVPGGFYAGRMRSKPHTVGFSEVDNPTDWPTAYRYDVRDNVVKLAVTSNSVFALTDGTPYVISGTAPESMTVTALAESAACVSEKSVCVSRNTVYFASNQGLYAIYNDADEGTVCKNLTAGLLTKEQWQELNPASCMTGQYDGALHLFFTTTDRETGETTHKAIIIDLADGQAVMTTHDEMAACLATDERSDELYFVREV